MSNLNNIPSNWKDVKIEDISLRIQYGYTASSTTRNTGVKLLRITDIQNYKVNWEQVPYCLIDEYDTKKFLLESGDIVFARTGATVGKSYLIQGDIPNAVFASYLIRIQLSRYINPNYLFYFFQSSSYWKQIGLKSIGIGQPSVNATSLSRLRLALAPLAEQNIIVNKLEEIFSAINNEQETLRKTSLKIKLYKIALLKNAFEGGLTMKWRENNGNGNAKMTHEMAGGKEPKKHRDPITKIGIPDSWRWTNIGALSSSLKNGIYKSSEFYSEDGTACLRMYNIGEGRVLWHDIKRMRLTSSELEEYSLHEGDLLVNRVNSRELVGKTAVIPKFMETCVYESKNIRVRLLIPELSQFLNYWFLFAANKFFSKNAQQTAGMASINHEQLASFAVPLPSLSEAILIVQEIEERFTLSENLEKALRNGIADLENFKISILNKAFSGQLVPNLDSKNVVDDLLLLIKNEKIHYQKNIVVIKKPKSNIMNKAQEILEILAGSDTPLPAKDVWQTSKFKDNIETFYAELKKIESQIIDDKIGTESYLSIRHEN